MSARPIPIPRKDDSTECRRRPGLPPSTANRRRDHDWAPDLKRPVFRSEGQGEGPMLWPSRRVVVAALALGTAPLLARAMAEERPDPWKSVARYELEYRVRLRELSPAPEGVALWVPYPAETRDQPLLDASIDSPWRERPAGPGRPRGGTGPRSIRA